MLRESYMADGEIRSRDLFDIGQSPSMFIKYAGGNAFYFDEEMENTVSDCAKDYDPEKLEDVFWPWVRPDIRRAVDTFRGRSAKSLKLTDTQKDYLATRLHPFDKRRVHYLKFARMDQGPLENMPLTIFKDLLNKSRDEIEQGFMRQEFALKAHELKSYVYTVFDLQRFFQSFMAKRMPHAMDQDKVDAYLVEELCTLNAHFFNRTDALDEYMIRYALMFFDHQYADTTLLDDFARAFMSSRRAYRPPAPKNMVSRSKAMKIFNLSPDAFKKLNKRSLRKIYRGLARKSHPDAGGSHKKFIELNGAYQTLLEKIGQ